MPWCPQQNPTKRSLVCFISGADLDCSCTSFRASTMAHSTVDTRKIPTTYYLANGDIPHRECNHAACELRAGCVAAKANDSSNLPSKSLFDWLASTNAGSVGKELDSCENRWVDLPRSGVAEIVWGDSASLFPGTLIP